MSGHFCPEVAIHFADELQPRFVHAYAAHAFAAEVAVAFRIERSRMLIDDHSFVRLADICRSLDHPAVLADEINISLPAFGNDRFAKKFG